MDFESMLDNIYENLEQKQKKKLVLPKLEISNSTTNTYWKNVKKLLQTINRGPDHFVNYMNKEIGQTNWVSSSKSDGLVIIGKVNKNKIINVIQNYMKEYVICKSCNSVNTVLEKNNVIRKYELICNDCKCKYII